jgi:hypothetical protein
MHSDHDRPAYMSNMHACTHYLLFMLIHETTAIDFGDAHVDASGGAPCEAVLPSVASPGWVVVPGVFTPFCTSLVLRSLWMERNTRVFEHSRSTAEFTLRLILNEWSACVACRRGYTREID